jgi:hypothetical protein
MDEPAAETFFGDIVAVSTSPPTTTCSENSSAVATPPPLSYSGCNAGQISSVCQCALSIYPWTASQHNVSVTCHNLYAQISLT